MKAVNKKLKDPTSYTFSKVQIEHMKQAGKSPFRKRVYQHTSVFPEDQSEAPLPQLWKDALE